MGDVRKGETTAATGPSWRPLREPGRNSVLAPSAFSRLAVTHALAISGDTLVTLSLAKSVFFNLSPGEAKAKVALSLILTMTPFAVVAPFLGPAIDRRKGGRRQMVIAAAAGRALCCLLMAANIDNALLFPFAFGALVLSKAHAVCKAALVPVTVGDDDGLVRANARLAMTGAVVGFVTSGPGLAISALFGAAWTLRFGAVVFLVAGVSARHLVEARHELAARAEVAGGVGPHREAGVYRAALAMAALRGIVGFLAFLLAFSFKTETGWLGFALALSVLGGFVGSALAPWLRGRLKEEWIVLCSLAGIVMAGLLTGRSGGKLGACLLGGMVGLAAGIGRLAFDSLAQRDTPEADQAKAFSRFEAGFQLVWVVGALLATLVPFSLGGGLVVVAAGAGVAGIAYSVASYRANRREVEGLPPKRLAVLRSLPVVPAVAKRWRRRRTPNAPDPPPQPAVPDEPSFVGREFADVTDAQPPWPEPQWMEAPTKPTPPAP